MGCSSGRIFRGGGLGIGVCRRVRVRVSFRLFDLLNGVMILLSVFYIVFFFLGRFEGSFFFIRFRFFCYKGVRC